MKKEVADKWVAALRSGQYKQGHYALRTTKDEYCCLGVLCDVAVKDGLQTIISQHHAVYAYNGHKGNLPPIVKSWADLTTHDGGYLDGFFTKCLAELNDMGCSFEEIADIIEEQWERL